MYLSCFRVCSDSCDKLRWRSSRHSPDRRGQDTGSRRPGTINSGSLEGSRSLLGKSQWGSRHFPVLWPSESHVVTHPRCALPDRFDTRISDSSIPSFEGIGADLPYFVSKGFRFPEHLAGRAHPRVSTHVERRTGVPRTRQSGGGQWRPHPWDWGHKWSLGYMSDLHSEPLLKMIMNRNTVSVRLPPLRESRSSPSLLIVKSIVPIHKWYTPLLNVEIKQRFRKTNRRKRKFGFLTNLQIPSTPCRLEDRPGVLTGDSDSRPVTVSCQGPDVLTVTNNTLLYSGKFLGQ